MNASEHLFAFFDALREAGTPVPSTNEECTRLVLGALEDVDIACLPFLQGGEDDEEVWEGKIAEVEESRDGIVNDLTAIIESWG